jgi:hypothetical protein
MVLNKLSAGTTLLPVRIGMVYIAGMLLTLGFNSNHVSCTDSLEHKCNVEHKDWNVHATYFVRSIEVFKVLFPRESMSA